MDNAQKAIMIGVGLFITIIIISAVMLITSAGQDLMDSSMDELSNISDSLSRQLYSDFANATLSGSEVIAAVKRYGGQQGLKLGIQKMENGVPCNYQFYADTPEKAEETKRKIGSIKDIVKSNEKYTSMVSMNKDNVVTSIVFIHKPN